MTYGYVGATSRGVLGALVQSTPIPLPLMTPRLHLQVSLSLWATDYCTLCLLLFHDCHKTSGPKQSVEEEICWGVPFQNGKSPPWRGGMKQAVGMVAGKRRSCEFTPFNTGLKQKEQTGSSFVCLFVLLSKPASRNMRSPPTLSFPGSPNRATNWAPCV